MRHIIGALALLAAAFLPSALLAAETCAEVTDKECELRKRTDCGPIILEFSVDEDGKKSCDRAPMLLTRGQVIPLLRRVRCVLIGDNTRVAFKATNFQARQGPKNGDLITVKNGSTAVIVFGHYDSSERDAVAYFQNIGPGSQVMLKCMAFGPA